MTFEQAIKILNLPQNFTEEELKQAYRAAINKYHPDLYKDNVKKEEMTTITQQVNAAYDYLKKYLRDKSVNHSSNDNYKKAVKVRHEYATKLNKLCEMDSVIYNHLFSKLQKICDEIWYISIEFLNLSAAMLKEANYNELIKACYEQQVNKLKSALEKLRDAFYEENNIDPNEIFFRTLNFDCGVEDFYKQLLEIKSQYLQMKQYEKILTSKFLGEEYAKNKPGYQEIRKQVKKLIKEAVKELLNRQDKETIIKKLNDDIFVAYFCNVVSQIQNSEGVINNEKFQGLCNKAKQSARNIGISSEDIPIASDLEGDVCFMSYKHIYINMLQRYKKALTSLSTQGIKEAEKIKEMAIKHFIRGCRTNKGDKYFELFNAIYFKDSLSDALVLIDIINYSEVKKDNKKKNSMNM